MAVRRESVEVRVDSNLTSVFTRDAAAAALLRRELDNLNNHPYFRGGNNSSSTNNSSFTRTTNQANQASSSINQLTGRLGAFADAALILGPGLVPIAAVGATAIGGLAAAATAATVAGSAAIVAFQGVGDAVKAASAYAIEPSTANLEKYRQALADLSPQAQRFVREFQQFRPVLTEIRNSAAEGLFPGLTRSLSDFEKVAPRIADLLNRTGAELGDIVADSAESLSGPRWVGFLGYLRDEMPGVMRTLSTIMGDLGHGAAVLMQRLDPGNDRFLSWVEGIADGFDKWATSGEGRDDIRAFLEYAQESGPEVAALFGSLAGAFGAIVQAAAPIGGPVLSALTAVTETVRTIAESDAATPLLAAYAAFRLYARGAALAAAAQARFIAAQRATGAGAGAAGASAATTRAARFSVAGQGAAAAGLIALSTTGLGDLTEKAQVSNAAMGALLGTMIAPGWGTAAGAIAGSLLDITAANDGLEDSIQRANLAIGSGDLTAAAQNLAKAREELAKLRTDSEDGGGFLGNALGGSTIGLIARGGDLWKGFEADKGAEAVKVAEDYYHAMYQISKLKPVSDYDALNDLFGELTGSITPTTNALNDFADAFQRANGFLDYRAGIVNYKEAIDAVTASIKENGRSLDENTEKGRANRTALDAVARTGLEIANSLTGTKKGTFLRALARDVRDAAEQFGTGKAEVDDYLEGLGLLNEKKVKPKVDLDDSRLSTKQRKAIAKLDKLAASNATPFADVYTSPLDSKVAASRKKMSDLDNAKANPFADLYTGQFDAGLSGARSDLAAFNGSTATAYLRIKTQRIEALGNAGVGPLREANSSADGSTVPKTGKPYADRHLYLLADGEEVISNRYGQADRFRPLLKQINANRMLADGGTAGADRSLKTLERTSDRLAKVLERVGTRLDKATSKLGDARDLRSQAGNTLARADLFGGGLAGFDLGLAANTNDTRAGTYALQQLKRRGLDGDSELFKQLAQSGDLDTLREFSQLSRSEINKREKRFARFGSAANALGDQSVLAEYGKSTAEIVVQVKGLRRDQRKANREARDAARAVREREARNKRSSARKKTSR